MSYRPKSKRERLEHQLIVAEIITRAQNERVRNRREHLRLSDIERITLKRTERLLRAELDKIPSGTPIMQAMNWPTIESILLERTHARETQ